MSDIQKKHEAPMAQNRFQPIEKTPSLLPNAETLQTVERLADYVIESGEYQKRFRNKAQAIMVMLRGNNLGITFDSALDHVYVVHGKTGISGQLMLRLIYERVPGAIVEFDDSIDQSQACEVTMGRPGHKPQVFRFTIEEADAAGITRNRDGSPNTVWKAYRQDMLRWRAVSRGARIVFPDAIQGCWLTSELSEVQQPEQSAPPRPAPQPEEVATAPAGMMMSDEGKASKDYTREDMKNLLQEYNEVFNTRHNYKTAAAEMIGLVLEPGDKFTQEEVNALCDVMTGAIYARKNNG